MVSLARAAVTALVSVAIAAGVARLAGGRAAPLGPASAPLALAALCFLINWLAFVPAAVLRTERFYDATGSLTYLAVVAAALAAAAAAGLPLGPGRLVPAALVTVWALRLGLFLLRRVHRAGKDVRFDEIKNSPSRFFVAWTLQGLWVFLTALAAVVLITTSDPLPIGATAAAGWALWAAGFAVEVVADRQKAAFQADPANRGRFIDRGLWAWSRHPNYFGEILLWTGVFVSGAGTYAGGQWIAALSPVFVALLLLRVSGVPLLEARADARWGQDPAYQAYKAQTPVLWPRPPRT